MSRQIFFEDLPLWRGAQSMPQRQETHPFGIGWDARGFIRQTTPEAVRRQVIDAYHTDEYLFITPPPGNSEWSSRRGDAHADFMKKVCGDLRGRSVLEIGAANLYIAEKIRRECGALRYCAMDPAIKDLPDTGVEVRRAYFNETSCAGETFDVVASFNCLEHVPDPVSFLSAIRKILARSDGKAVLVFPDNEKQFERGDLNAILHEHMSYFTKNICLLLFQAAGFQILDSRSEEDTFSFYLCVDPYFENKKKPLGPEIGDVILAQADEAFLFNIERMRENIEKLLQKGRTVAFHGATNGLNNLLWLTGFKNERRLLIFDGDKTKAGKYLPCCPTSIRAADDPSYARADRLFVSAMTFYEPIRRFAMAHHGLAADAVQPLFVQMREKIDAVRL